MVEISSTWSARNSSAGSHKADEVPLYGHRVKDPYFSYKEISITVFQIYTLVLKAHSNEFAKSPDSKLHHGSKELAKYSQGL